MYSKVLKAVPVVILGLILSGCTYTVPELRVDTNKNDFRLYPLDVKKPTIIEIEPESEEDSQSVVSPTASTSP